MSATLIYDSDCRLCLKAVAWVQHHAQDGALYYLPCQSGERAERFPELPTEQCMEAMQLVMPDGRSFSGEAALPHLLAMLRGWKWLAWAFRLPGVGLLSGPAYRFIARNRYVFSIVVARKELDSGQACPTDESCE